jgi:hypothetical protein
MSENTPPAPKQATMAAGGFCALGLSPVLVPGPQQGLMKITAAGANREECEH